MPSIAKGHLLAYEPSYKNALLLPVIYYSVQPNMLF